MGGRWRAGVVVAAIVGAVAIAGCMTPTRFRCAPGSVCVRREIAESRCKAVAALASDGGRTSVYGHCMRGEGFIEVACDDPDDIAGCDIFHGR